MRLRKATQNQPRLKANPAQLDLEPLKMTSLSIGDMMTFQGWIGPWTCFSCEADFHGIVPYSAIILKHPAHVEAPSNRAASIPLCARCVESMRGNMPIQQTVNPARPTIDGPNDPDPDDYDDCEED